MSVRLTGRPLLGLGLGLRVAVRRQRRGRIERRRGTRIQRSQRRQLRDANWHARQDDAQPDGGRDDEDVHHVPSPVAERQDCPIPFVAVFHGAGDGRRRDVRHHAVLDLADSEGVAVVVPPTAKDTSSITGQHVESVERVGQRRGVCGDGRPWNNAKAGDDFEFVDAMKADIAQDQCLDAAARFVAGFSMGGYFAHQSAATAPTSAQWRRTRGNARELSSCRTGHVPIIIFHGTADPLISPSCDDRPGAHTSRVHGFRDDVGAEERLRHD